MAGILYCRHCQTGHASVGAVPETCPHCLNSANWSTSLEPRVPYELTLNDRRFLKGIHVAPEEGAIV
jgi:hypothetical protein